MGLDQIITNPYFLGIIGVDCVAFNPMSTTKRVQIAKELGWFVKCWKIDGEHLVKLTKLEEKFKRQ